MDILQAKKAQLQPKAQEAQEVSRRVYQEAASGQAPKVEDMEALIEKSREALHTVRETTPAASAGYLSSTTSAPGIEHALAQSKTLQTAERAMMHAEELIKDLDSKGQLQTTLTGAVELGKDIYKTADLGLLARVWTDILRQVMTPTKGQNLLSTLKGLTTDVTTGDEWTRLLMQTLSTLRDMLLNKQLGDEQKRQLLDQLRDNLRTLGNNPHYRTLLTQTKQTKEEVQVHAEKGLSETIQQAQKISESPHLQEVEKGAEQLLETVAGPQTTRKALNDFKDLLRDVESRQEFYRNYFDTVGMLLQNVIQNPDKLEDKEVQDQFSKLFDMGEAIVDQLGRDLETHNIPKDLKEISKVAMEHPAAKALAQDVAELSSQLMSGELIAQIRQAVVPYLMQVIQELPLPPVKGTANSAVGKFDYDLDNVYLRTKEIIPDSIKVKLENEFNFHPMNLSTSGEKTILKIHVKGINADFKNIHFKYRRITTPHIHDEGFLDTRLAGKGLRIWLHLHLYFDAANRLIVEKQLVRATLDRIDIDVRETRHSAKVYDLLASMWSGTLKDSLCSTIESALSKGITTFEEGINTMLASAYEVSEGMVRLKEALSSSQPLEAAKKELAKLAEATQATGIPEKAMQAVEQAMSRVDVKAGPSGEPIPVIYADKEREERDRLGKTQL